MKKLILLIGVLTASAAHAGTSYTCDITSTDGAISYDLDLGVAGSTYTLSEEQDTRVEIDRSQLFETVSIGDQRFESTEMEIAEGEKLLRMKIKRNEDNIRLTLYKETKLGVLTIKEEGQRKYETFARFDCNDYSEEKEYILGTLSDGLEKADPNSLPEAIRSGLSEMDLPFELADGYYGVISEDVYPVESQGKVIGYIVETHLSYTEGDDEYVTSHFLANGIRFHSSNW